MEDKIKSWDDINTNTQEEKYVGIVATALLSLENRAMQDGVKQDFPLGKYTYRRRCTDKSFFKFINSPSFITEELFLTSKGLKINYLVGKVGFVDSLFDEKGYTYIRRGSVLVSDSMYILSGKSTLDYRKTLVKSFQLELDELKNLSNLLTKSI